MAEKGIKVMSLEKLDAMVKKAEEEDKTPPAPNRRLSRTTDDIPIFVSARKLCASSPCANLPKYANLKLCIAGRVRCPWRTWFRTLDFK